MRPAARKRSRSRATLPFGALFDPHGIGGQTLLICSRTVSEEKKRGGNGCLYLLMVVGVLMVVGGASVDFLAGVIERMPSEEEAPVVASSEDPKPPSLPELEPTTMPTHETEPMPILWHAQALDAPNVPRGAACLIAVHVGRDAGNLVAERITLRCAGNPIERDAPSIAPTVLHDSTITDDSLEQVALADGWYAYRADISSEQGLRITTAERTVSGPQGTFFIEDLSVPRRWTPEPGSGEPEITSLLRFAALPTKVEGAAPSELSEAARTASDVARGRSACELTAAPVPSASGYNCRLLLRCGATTLYGTGTSGYNACVVRDGRIVSADDPNESPNDTDPRVRLDIDEGIIEISDTTDAGSWSASFSIGAHPRCEAISATWRGVLFGADREEAGVRITLDPNGDSVALLRGGAEETAPLASRTIDCPEGRVLAGADHPDAPNAELYHLFASPGFAALAGEHRTLDAPAHVLWIVR